MSKFYNKNIQHNHIVAGSLQLEYMICSSVIGLGIDMQ